MVNCSANSDEPLIKEINSYAVICTSYKTIGYDDLTSKMNKCVEKLSDCRIDFFLLA